MTIGPPYIPEVIKLQKKISEETQDDITYLLGGQVVRQGKFGLTQSQFLRLFGNSSYNGNNDEVLASVLGINPKGLILPQQTSLIPAYKKIPDEIMKLYLSKEFGLYVSQGCHFHCDFCGAVRTIQDPVTGEWKKVVETYREPEIIKKDLGYLVMKAKQFGISELQIYMSNLDVFQNPNQLLSFVYAVRDVKKSHPDFDIKLRGLSTAISYDNVRDKSPKIIEELVKAGFYAVGFGVDGMAPQVWKGINKGFNNEKVCLEAIISAKEDFGIIPEVLMVFGHVGVDTEETLKLACEFTEDMINKYKAVPRPHVAKSFIPENKGWVDRENADSIETLLKNPASFQALDFTALPSKLTHPDDKIRELATNYFLEMCKMEGNTTQYVKPITPDLTLEEIEEVKKSNERKYDR